ncbi:MAG TPA: thioredoxin domain-containing protein [Pyrinomonadaceae bacterium]|nr:thioredoxin domain-containing protein [Pyrinomonadaceae bacterium]
MPIVIIIAVFAVAMIAFLIMTRSFSDDARKARLDQPLTPSAARPDSRPRTPQPGAQPPHERGDASAAATIEEFGDFQCPPCGSFHPELKKIEADYGSRLRVVFRHLPLPQIHKNAIAAAQAAEAAGRQGRFWQMHDMLYENQSAWEKAADAPSMFSSYARSLGLDVQRFAGDLNSSDVNNRIRADMLRADSLGVTGTPTLFLNGREITLPSSNAIQYLRGQIDAALAEKKQ